MSPKPTGRVVGDDLIITRTFFAPIDDVWASVTKPESTALWFGRWQGEAAPGRVVRLQLGFENDQPWTDVLIERCDAPRHLVITMKDEHGDWRLALTLTEKDGGTELRFVQRLSDPSLAADIGPGWEYYLDMLAAVREGKPRPSFDDYYPAQKAHYLQRD